MVTRQKKATTKATGTRMTVGAGRSTRLINPQAEIERIENLGERERHIFGRLYEEHNGKVYDENLIDDRRDFFFEPAWKMPFVVHDCIGHSVNYLARHPIFTYRE
jgi:hypothetical protein